MHVVVTGGGLAGLVAARHLTDGTLEFDVDAISGAWEHPPSLADLGFE